MIRFTDNKRIIDGRTVTQIVQDGPIASNLVDVVEPNQLGGWIESKESLPHTSWIDENVILFKEAYVGEYSVITATQPDTIVSVYDPIYEKLKKRDKQNQVKKIVPKFVTAKQETESSRPSSHDTRNFLMCLAGEPGTRRYKWMKRLETLALIVGLATILNLLVRIFLIR